jgi:hypothetical protein
LNADPALAGLFNSIGEISKKLDSLILLSKQILEAQEDAIRLNGLKLEPDAMTLSFLPASLRKTVMALYKLEKATALDISKETKRLRAVESASANQLVRMGYLKKKREGRAVYFYIESSSEM